MTGTPAEQAPTRVVGALPPANELRTAIRVARRMLAGYGDPTGWDVYAYAQAHGALAESLRILLRALDAEPAPDAEKGYSSVSTPGGEQGSRSEGWTSMTNVQLPGEQRCPAAHPEDPSPCGGPVVVTILDAQNAGANGCEHHGARLLASLDGGRVYPLPDAPEQAAIRVFKAADGIRPFPWLTDAPRTQAEQLSRAESQCGRCREPFDPADTRFDGRARYRDTPWCRRCIDNCHEGSAEHVCVICDPARYGGELR